MMNRASIIHTYIFIYLYDFTSTTPYYVIYRGLLGTWKKRRNEETERKISSNKYGLHIANNFTI